MSLPLIRLFEGDSLDVLATIPGQTYTAFVTDPPYGLSTPPDPYEVLLQWLTQGDFIRTGGRKKPPPFGTSELAARLARSTGGGGFLSMAWDAFVPGPRLWREVFRTCKPGAIGAVFASPRTQHWMALALVLAGFEVLDVIGHVQAQGMSKSGTVDKRIDRRRHDRDVVLRCTKWIRERCDALGLKPRDLDAACGTNGMGSHWTSAKSQPYVPTREQWAKLEPLLGPMPPEMEAQRLIIEARAPGETSIWGNGSGTHVESLPGTETSAEWAGYSTQLAPGIEPIIIVRRPCEGTAVQNVLVHGCGAMNIDACRIESGADYHELQVTQGRTTDDAVALSGRYSPTSGEGESLKFKPAAGRWPKNVMLSAEAAAILDDQVGERASGSRRAGVRKGIGYGSNASGDGGPEITGSSGGPSRFFWVGPLATADDVDLPIRYVPKASKADRAAGLDNIENITIVGTWNDQDLAVDLRVDTAISPPRVTFASGVPTRSVCEWSTFLFGSEFTAPSPKECKFIIETESGTTTESKTLSYFLRQHTSENTVGASGETEWSTNRVENAARSIQSLTITKVLHGSRPTAEVVASKLQLRASVAANKNAHPTVKPPALMEWLCRLVGHPRGRLLDPFAGSGTTLRAARKLGLPCDGVERDHHYCIDLAAPRAGIDPGDVRRVDPPAPLEKMLADLPPPPAHPLPAPDEPAIRVGAPPTSPVLGDARVPSLEIPLQPRLVADDFAGVPPMFPRLPGAPETT